MSEPNLPKPGPVPGPQQRAGAEIEEAMAAVRALPTAQPSNTPSSTEPNEDGDAGSADAVDQIDLDEQIETLTAAHDTLRRQLSSIDR